MIAWFGSLPRPARAGLIVAIAFVALMALIFVYDWIGTTLIDTGGTVG